MDPNGNYSTKQAHLEYPSSFHTPSSSLFTKAPNGKRLSIDGVEFIKLGPTINRNLVKATNFEILHFYVEWGEQV